MTRRIDVCPSTTLWEPWVWKLGHYSQTQEHIFCSHCQQVSTWERLIPWHAGERPAWSGPKAYGINARTSWAKLQLHHLESYVALDKERGPSEIQYFHQENGQDNYQPCIAEWIRDQYVCSTWQLLEATNMEDGMIVTIMSVMRIRKGRKWAQTYPEWRAVKGVINILSGVCVVQKLPANWFDWNFLFKVPSGSWAEYRCECFKRPGQYVDQVSVVWLPGTIKVQFTVHSRQFKVKPVSRVMC